MSPGARRWLMLWAAKGKPQRLSVPMFVCLPIEAFEQEGVPNEFHVRANGQRYFMNRGARSPIYFGFWRYDETTGNITRQARGSFSEVKKAIFDWMEIPGALSRDEALALERFDTRVMAEPTRHAIRRRVRPYVQTELAE